MQCVDCKGYRHEGECTTKRCGRCGEVMDIDLVPDGCEDFHCPMLEPEDARQFFEEMELERAKDLLAAQAARAKEEVNHGKS